jgi:hypothetical protein
MQSKPLKIFEQSLEPSLNSAPGSPFIPGDSNVASCLISQHQILVVWLENKFFNMQVIDLVEPFRKSEFCRNGDVALYKFNTLKMLYADKTRHVAYLVVCSTDGIIENPDWCVVRVTYDPEQERLQLTTSEDLGSAN